MDLKLFKTVKEKIDGFNTRDLLNASLASSTVSGLYIAVFGFSGLTLKIFGTLTALWFFTLTSHIRRSSNTNLNKARNITSITSYLMTITVIWDVNTPLSTSIFIKTMFSLYTITFGFIATSLVDGAILRHEKSKIIKKSGFLLVAMIVLVLIYVIVTESVPEFLKI